MAEHWNNDWLSWLEDEEEIETEEPPVTSGSRSIVRDGSGSGTAITNTKTTTIAVSSVISSAASSADGPATSHAAAPATGLYSSWAYNPPSRPYDVHGQRSDGFYENWRERSDDNEAARSRDPNVVYRNFTRDPDVINATFIVPAWSVARIIGKDGSQVKFIQKYTNCHVSVSRSDGPTNKVLLKGTDEAIAKAKMEIMNIINSHPYGAQRRGNGGKTPTIITKQWRPPRN